MFSRQLIPTVLLLATGCCAPPFVCCPPQPMYYPAPPITYPAVPSPAVGTVPGALPTYPTTYGYSLTRPFKHQKKKLWPITKQYSSHKDPYVVDAISSQCNCEACRAKRRNKHKHQPKHHSCQTYCDGWSDCSDTVCSDCNPCSNHTLCSNCTQCSDHSPCSDCLSYSDNAPCRDCMTETSVHTGTTRTFEAESTSGAVEKPPGMYDDDPGPAHRDTGAEKIPPPAHLVPPSPDEMPPSVEGEPGVSSAFLPPVSGPVSTVSHQTISIETENSELAEELITIPGEVVVRKRIQ